MDETYQISNLQLFTPPTHGEITLCELDGRVHSSPSEIANINSIVNILDKHKKIHITRDMLQTAKSSDEGKNLFLPVQVPFVKEILQIYYEQGFFQAVKAISKRDKLILSRSASLLLTAIVQFNSWKSVLYPHIQENSQHLLAQLSRTRNWGTSPIRAIAWHPHCLKLAVATFDDCVRIYSSDTQLIPMLKCKQQRNITCIAWRPMSNSCIAIACEKQIIVWEVDPSSVVTRPSINNCLILSRPGHTPIVDISWSPRGDVLASVAALDTKILMWNVEMDQADILRRPSGSGNYLVRWAPNNSKVVTATNTLVFRVWDCIKWEAERWHIDVGYMKTACWSPCASILLFVTNTEACIYALSFVRYDRVFTSDGNTSPNQAICLYDLAKAELDGVLVGGDVRDMCWDLSGIHLAILFNTTNCVAIFTVVMQPKLHLIPGCLVAGLPDEVPAVIAFQQNFETGACLTIGWSSGRVQYFPMVYSDLNGSAERNTNSSYRTSAPSNMSMYHASGSYY